MSLSGGGVQETESGVMVAGRGDFFRGGKSAAQELLDAFRFSCESDGDVGTIMALIDRLMDSESGNGADADESAVEPELEQRMVCNDNNDDDLDMDTVLPHHILQHIVKLLTDKFTQVRKTCQAGLLLLVERGIITPSQVEDHIVPIVMEYTGAAAHEDYRTEMTQFMIKVAPLVGKDVTVRAYLARFCRLCHDQLFQVRRVCASSIGDIASIVGPNLTEEVLISRFRFLCQDDVWGVRKACAESITIFSSCCKRLSRSGILTEIFVELLRDSSRWVRMAACQSLGPFITTFAIEHSSSTSDCGEADQEFMLTYKSSDFDIYSNQKKTDSNCDPDSNSHAIEMGGNFNSKDVVEKREILDQNQNSKLVPTPDYTVVPMDIDEDHHEENLVSDLPNVVNEREFREEECADVETTNSIEPNDLNSNLTSSGADRDSAESDSNSNQHYLQNSSLEANKIVSDDENSTIEYNTWQYWRDPIRDVSFVIPPSMSQISNMSHGEADDHCSKSSGLESGVDKQDMQVTTVEEFKPEGYVSGVHRSYVNLFSASRDQGFVENGFEALKLEGYGEDDERRISAFLDDDDEFDLLENKDCRPKLLAELPKSGPIHQDVVPAVLLDYFTSFCQQNKDNPTMDHETLSFCVYNLPAVVLTLGPQNWPLLRDCYESLACSVQWKVRYTLASSLHEIASILGPELSERDLLPFYNAITKDVDEVRIGILRNLASFVKNLGGDAQRRCLSTLDRFFVTENLRNWRFRLELAHQAKLLMEYYSAEDIFKYFWPLTLGLLMDRVSEVRKCSLNVIPSLIHRLNNPHPNDIPDPSMLAELLSQLVKSLANSDVWVRRQAFASLAGQLMETGAISPDQFAEDILPALVNLSKDKVPNVRLKVAQSIVLSVLNEAFLDDATDSTRETLHTTLNELQQDEDSDVRDCSIVPDNNGPLDLTYTCEPESASD